MRQWSPAVGDVVWAKEHHLSKAAKGFGPCQVLDFDFPVICNQKEIADYPRWRV